MEFLKKLRFLNGNTLKLIAAISMFIDHFGLIFYPNELWFRAVGRLAMPLFAFAIAEGCRDTKNKVKHFCLLFGLGVLCQIVYAIFDPTDQYFGILITFSISTLLIYALQFAKTCTFSKDVKTWKTCAAWALFAAGVVLTYILCENYKVDYGFYGCMLPVTAALFDFHRIPAPDLLQKFDRLPLRAMCFSAWIIYNVAIMPDPPFMIYTLCVIPLLFLYNGEKGKWNIKYFFYIFYPLHLGLLQGIQMLLQMSGR